MSGSRSHQKQVDELFQRYGPLVYRRALKILRNEAQAEEATQEIFVRVIKGIDRFDGRSKLSTWLFQVTMNHCLNQLRNEKRRRELWEEQVMPQAAQGGQTSAPKDQVILRELMAVADPDLAAAALCVFVEGMTGAEAAEALSVSRRTVINRVERFKAWARDYLTGTDPPEAPPDSG